VKVREIRTNRHPEVVVEEEEVVVLEPGLMI